VRPAELRGRLVSVRELDGSDVPALHAVYGDARVCGYMSFTPRTERRVRRVGGLQRRRRLRLRRRSSRTMRADGPQNLLALSVRLLAAP
jgi:hypothetical protein